MITDKLQTLALGSPVFCNYGVRFGQVLSNSTTTPHMFGGGSGTRDLIIAKLDGNVFFCNYEVDFGHPPHTENDSNDN